MMSHAIKQQEYCIRFRTYLVATHVSDCVFQHLAPMKGVLIISGSHVGWHWWWWAEERQTNHCRNGNHHHKPTPPPSTGNFQPASTGNLQQKPFLITFSELVFNQYSCCALTFTTFHWLQYSGNLSQNKVLRTYIIWKVYVIVQLWQWYWFLTWYS